MKLPNIATPLVYLAFIRNMALGHESEKNKSKNIMKQSTKFLRRKLQTGLTDTEKQEALDKHNELRSTVALGNQGSHPSAANMVKMQWSDELAQLAQNYAEECIDDHNPDRVSQQNIFSSVGENLKVTQFGLDMDGHIQDWFDEEQDFDYSSNSCSAYCTHYTQVVWATSYAVGCGVFYCASIDTWWGGDISALNVVCNYGPAGNWFGEKPYTEGVPASDCPAEFPYAEEGTGLCTDEEPVIETDDGDSAGDDGNGEGDDGNGEGDDDEEDDGDSTGDDGNGEGDDDEEEDIDDEEDDSSSTGDDTSTLNECESQTIISLLLQIIVAILNLLLCF